MAPIAIIPLLSYRYHMVPSVSEEYDWREWVWVCLISQTTSSNNTIHFCDFHHESVEYRMCCLTFVRKNVPLPNDHSCDSRLQCSVALCNVDRFGLNHLPQLDKGLPPYILRMGSGRMDGRDVYGLRGGLQWPCLWWGDATTAASADLAPSQRWCGRGVLACLFELRILT